MRPVIFTLLIGIPGLAAQAVELDDDFVATRDIACWAAAPIAADPDTLELAEDVIELTTGNADIQAGGDAKFTGPVEVRSRGRLLRAGAADYNGETGTFDTRGGVEYIEQGSRFAGEAARYNSRNGELELEGAEFEVSQTPARGEADKIRVDRDGTVKLHRVEYTSCPPGNDDWLLRAKSIELDQNTGMGTARKATLRFKGVPFLYVPYFTYPIIDERKSGLLFPKLGTSERRGFEFTQPIYWNIAPAYDMTFVPRYMSKRGVQLGIENRFLTQRHDITTWGDYLPSDNEADRDRWRFDLEAQSDLPAGWRAETEFRGISDNDYPEDLSAQRSQTSRTHLARQVEFERYGPVWSVRTLFQDYQTIDSQILADDEPYLQLPRIQATGIWRDSLFNMDYRLDAEANYFYREDSVTGARINMRPVAEIPMQRGGLYIRPAFALDLTAYSLQDVAAGDDDTPGRAAPIATLDAGAVFERSLGDSDAQILTLEPRLLYAYVPFRDQDDLPVFDTIRPDFNLVQLYRYNQFVGLDRLSDSNQLSIGVTSRVLNADNGRELLTATIGQTLFIDKSDVVLPGESPSEEDSTDYLAEVGISVWEKWRITGRYQYDTDTNSAARASVRVRYRPDDGKVFNVAYRFARESLEQTDFSFSYPLGRQWNAIGRYNYSIADNDVLDQALGLEYNGCCWGISLLSRRSVARSTGERESSFALQFTLKGFSNFGSATAMDLRRDILDGNRF